MGNCLAIAQPKRKCCSQAAMCSHREVLHVKTDGQNLEYTRPMFVKDVLMNFSGYGIGLSERPVRHLPLSYELKVGHIYYLLPLSSPACFPCSVEIDSRNGTKRIKVVITKQQLQELLANKMSVEKMLLGIQKGAGRRWRPVLEPIPEGSE